MARTRMWEDCQDKIERIRWYKAAFSLKNCAACMVAAHAKQRALGGIFMENNGEQPEQPQSNNQAGSWGSPRRLLYQACSRSSTVLPCTTLLQCWCITPLQLSRRGSDPAPISSPTVGVTELPMSQAPNHTPRPSSCLQTQWSFY